MMINAFWVASSPCVISWPLLWHCWWTFLCEVMIAFGRTYKQGQPLRSHWSMAFAKCWLSESIKPILSPCLCWTIDSAILLAFSNRDGEISAAFILLISRLQGKYLLHWFYFFGMKTPLGFIILMVNAKIPSSIIGSRFREMVFRNVNNLEMVLVSPNLDVLCCSFWMYRYKQ